MLINIDEYDIEYFCYVCKRVVSQHRVLISMSMDRSLNGEIHLHKKVNLECHGTMIQDSKKNVTEKSFTITDTSSTYETCARLVMDFIDNGYEITCLKLG
jgi:hypothetical protein